MFKLKNESIAIPVVLIAGILWSFGPLSSSLYGSTRISTMAVFICERNYNFYFIKYLFIFFFEEGLDFYKNYLKIGYQE